MPTTVEFSGISSITTEFAPILVFIPILSGLEFLLPAPTITLSSIVGCLFPLFELIPPSVTP